MLRTPVQLTAGVRLLAHAQTLFHDQAAIPTGYGIRFCALVHCGLFAWRNTAEAKGLQRRMQKSVQAKILARRS